MPPAASIAARAPLVTARPFTFTALSISPDLIIFTLETVAGGTRLSLEHNGLPSTEETFGLALALDKGWEDHMARMRADAHEAAPAEA